MVTGPTSSQERVPEMVRYAPLTPPTCPTPRGLRVTGKRNEMQRQMIGAHDAPAMGETV